MGGREHGQVSGHASAGFSWADYVAWLVEDHGSLAAVALKLSLARGGEEDALSIERALRRVRTRGPHDAGAWGKRLLKCFGLPGAIEARVRWMGLYHTRFSDLPVPVCLDLLRAWDKPPISDSASGVFLALGLAHCALRGRQWREAESMLDRAKVTRGQNVPAHCEHALARGYLCSQLGDSKGATAALEIAARGIEKLEPGAERECFEARLKDQLAYLASRAREPNYEEARGLYASIADNGPAFARGKRALGLAYVAFKTGDLETASNLARAAVSHAGDGGFVRHRAIALGLLSRVAAGDEARAAKERAAAISAQLEDEDLLERTALAPRPAPA